MENGDAEKTVGKRVPNPGGKGGFKPGHPGGPGRGKKKPKPAAGVDLLADMDRAYTTAESPDDSTIVKALRRLAHDDPVKFIEQYTRAKGKAPAAVEAEEVEVFGSVGPKEVGVEELAERLLSEWEKEESGGGHSAPVA